MSISLPHAGSRTDSRSSLPTLAQAFDTLLKSLSIEDSRPKASKQQHGLRDNLAAHLAVQLSLLTGSYRRGTQIPPLDDIDVLLVMDPSVYGGFQVDTPQHTAALLGLVRKALGSAYPKSEIQLFERCIRIEFTGTGIGFDVTPAFQLSQDVFVIPDSRLGRWIRTNPKEHQRQISDANQNVCGQWLIPLVKLLKLWNQQHGRLLTGFHLEVMAYRALRHAPRDARDGMDFLFGALATEVRSPTPDPWPQGLDVDAGLDARNRERAAERLKEAADLARAAVRAEQAGELEAAHWGWRQLFGPRYPEAGRKAAPVQPLTPFAAAGRIARGSAISATSAGLVSPSAGASHAASGTSHGGEWEPEIGDVDGASGSIDEAERQVDEVLAQFGGLRRVTPETAVLDPGLWPVHGHDPATLHAVLVGEQRTNLGRRHRVLVAVPAGAPIAESKVYALDYRPLHTHDGTGRYRPARPVPHLWKRGSLCTHAQCDRWDGRIVTLMIWAAEWLFRQDYYQHRGVWLGAEIGRRGERRVNALHGGIRRERSR